MKRTSRMIMRVMVICFAIMFLTGCSGCTRIEPGYVGIKVDMMGTDRGVSNMTLQTGFITYVPFMTRILEWPTFVQTANWSHSATEGRTSNDEICFNTKEQLTVCVDISLSYQLDKELIPQFYVKFRTDDLDLFTHGFLRNIAKDAFTEVGSTFSVDEINGPEKGKFMEEVKKKVNGQVKHFGVNIQQFGFLNQARLPEGVTNAINAKIKATQDAIKVENELRSAKAEAQKVIAEAEGKAKSNIILTQSITPQLLQWRQFELKELELRRWNGVLPTVQAGGGTNFLMQLPK